MAIPLDDDQRLFEYIAGELYTAVLSDACDAVGRPDQAMDAFIRPVYDEAVLVGRAKCLVYADVYHVPENPYELEIAAMDSIRPGEVVVMATGRSARNAPWGELMSTACIARGGRGAITDGLVRDITRIKQMRFPVFAAGAKPVDSKGRGLAVAYDVPVELGGVRVQPGDLIVGDLDGIVVIPQDAEPQVLGLADEKVHGENMTRQELQEGKLLGEVYARYGVL